MLYLLMLLFKKLFDFIGINSVSHEHSFLKYQMKYVFMANYLFYLLINYNFIYILIIKLPRQNWITYTSAIYTHKMMCQI